MSTNVNVPQIVYQEDVHPCDAITLADAQTSLAAEIKLKIRTTQWEERQLCAFCVQDDDDDMALSNLHWHLIER